MNQPSKSVLVTGANGYIGGLTIQSLAQHRHELGAIVACDIRPVPPGQQREGVQYVTGDIRAPEMADIMAQYQINTVVHLASIVTPGKQSNREFEYSVDVLGTQNILEACLKTGVTQIIVTSSGAAYGYYPDNPNWLTEADPLRGNEEFAYSHHKRLVEEMLAQYRQNHPELSQLILRPGTILGTNVRNQITQLFEKKYVIGIQGSEAPFVFIWDQDVVNIIVKGILEDKAGIYNLAGDGTLSMRQIAQIMSKPFINMPPGLLKMALSLLKKLNLTQYGPEQINFIRYRPVLLNSKLKEKFGYTPTYTSAEVFNLYLESRKNNH